MLSDARPFLRHIEAANRHDPGLYVPFVMAGAEVGLVRRDALDALRAYPDVFDIGDAVTFLQGGDQATRSGALAGIVGDMAAKGRFKLRNEMYPVATGWGRELLATIDRSAYQFFGTRGFGVHVNGLVRRQDGLHLWVAMRSMDRTVAPGKLDNIIGGGLAAGYTAFQTLIKEAGEEAGLDNALASQAVPVSAVSYIYDGEAGAKRDTLFIYDLYLPEDVVPDNQDGEVDHFELMPIEVVAALVSETNDFKLNVNLVIIDLLVRLGYLGPDTPGYAEVLDGLRKP